MGYRITYKGPEPKAPVKINRRRIIALAMAVMLLAAAAAGQLFPEQTNGIRDFLLPGDAEVTREAFETLVSEMHGGADLQEALVAFCQHILDEA